MPSNNIIATYWIPNVSFIKLLTYTLSYSFITFEALIKWSFIENIVCNGNKVRPKRKLETILDFGNH